MSKSEPTKSSNSQINNNYFLKYYYDNVFVIGDNELKQNIEIMIGNLGLYCVYHDTWNQKQECEHIKFIDALKELTKLDKNEN